MQAVNAGVHRTYSMFVEILEKSPNFEGRGGECSPPLILYIENGKGKGGSLGWVWKDIPIYDCINFAGISYSP